MKIKLFKILFIVTFLILAVSVVGCSSQNDNEAESLAEGKVDDGNKVDDENEGVLTIALPTEMATMDIYDHNDHVTLHAVNNMFNSLFTRNNTGEVEVDLVEAYESVNDVTWNFKLKEGILFHNGDELTSEDVKFTLERVANDEALIEHGTFNIIKEIKIIDDYNFEITTNEPNPLLLNVLARPGAGIYPKDHIEEIGWDKFFEEPIGTGPYKFVELDRGSQITLEPFDDYYDGKHDEWEKVVFRTIGEGSTRTGELLTGGVDIIPNVNSNEWERIEENENTYLSQYNSQRVAIIVPRATEGSPTVDKRVREAIDYAIDNEAIINALLGGAATPTKTRVTPGNFGSNEQLFDTFNYDVEKAKSLLAEAGYEDGLELTMQSSNGRYARDVEVAEMIVGMLSEVGIAVNLELVEWNTYLEMRRANNVGDLHMVMLANSYYDGHIIAFDLLESDRSMDNLGYDNEELKQLLTSSITEMNMDERDKMLQRAQEIIDEEKMRLYLYLEHNSYGVNEKVDFTPRLDELIKVYDISKK